MRSLQCPTCHARVFFENDRCLTCGTTLGFEPGSFAMVAPSSPIPGGGAPATGDGWAPCTNREVAGCNWVVPARSAGALCRSCGLTRTRPDDGDAEGHQWFLEAEAAKRRLVAQLLDLGLPVVGFAAASDGLGFDLLTSHFDTVTTGHEDGLITVDLAEADDSHRERVRNELGEAYRTVLGHFRHEVGHYYWMVLVRDAGRLDEFRRRFGDERADYRQAMQAHYSGAGPGQWQDTHVSAYATMHPWEDWAETFAHVLHILDALQTAAATGLTVISRDVPGGVVAPGDVQGRSFDGVVEQWIPLAGALNALNRSMGEADLYPFVLSPTVIDKLGFVDGLLRGPVAQPT
jgi:hypothetical protein